MDVNVATAERLQALPGVGPALARAIIEARPLHDKADLARVKGLGDAKRAELRGRVAFGKAEDVAEGKAKAEAPEAVKTKAGEAGAKAKAKASEVAEEEARHKKVEAAKGKMKSRAEAATETTQGKVETAGEPVSSQPPAGRRININTASPAELDQLFGIGEVRARAIVEGRPYKAIEEIKKVKGIGEGIVAKMKDRITVK